ncbi:DUF3108 domain-containing protein [Alteromonas sp. ASW11-36]|uniref:DUF3108 domain-containing protein n=1 Tax=Alteromonas arenosi TaxID=3055817 RepID=A0ABT7SX49_9ALTE|nr:DUF3108 domain-containing protein [Alteromonas sp. ASW11-36]MDM7860768.1 DUF3108 domain-containing protein [Alteromonas sp. ASW11-36]
MKKNFLPWALLLTNVLCACIGTSAFAQTANQQLLPFTAEYIAYRYGDDIGSATLELQHLGYDRYALTYRSRVSKFFLSDKRHEHSIFKFDGNSITAKEYYYSRGGTGPDKELTVMFDESNQSISVDNNRLQDWQGEVDNQLFRIDVPRQLAQGKTEMRYDFINYRGEPRTYIIKVVGKEQLELPYGIVDSIKVTIDRGSSSRETFAWFSPSLDHSLVRLQQFKDGEEQGDIKLKAYSVNTQG